jgi:hypothetical protein
MLLYVALLLLHLVALVAEPIHHVIHVDDEITYTVEMDQRIKHQNSAMIEIL